MKKSHIFKFLIFFCMLVGCSPTTQEEIITGFFGEREYHDHDYYAEIYLMPARYYLLCWEYNHTWESALVTGGMSGVKAHLDDAYYCQKYYPCPFPIMKEIIDDRRTNGQKPSDRYFEPEVIITSYPATAEELYSVTGTNISNIELSKKIHEYFDLYWPYESYE